MNRTLLLLLLCVSTALSAQTLTGTVADEKGNPIEYATVVIRSVADSSYVNGGVTDGNGNFAIGLSDSKLLKNSFATFSCIGYETLTVNPIGIEELDIRLRMASNELAEVVIRSERAIEIQPDGQKIDVRRLGLNNIGNIYDMLGMVPGLAVRNEEIEVVGRGTPLVYVNGRQLQDANELSRYDAEDIISVKVITNPGARFDASANSVIEIKTRNPEDGLGGNVLVRGDAGSKLGARQYASLIYKKEPFDLFLTLNNALSQNKPSSTTDLGLPDAYHTKLVLDADQTIKQKYRYVITGFNVTLSDKFNVGAQYNFTHVPNYDAKLYVNTLKRQGESIGNEEQHSLFHDKNHYHNLNAYIRGDISQVYSMRFDMNYFNKDDKTVNHFAVTKEAETNQYVSDLSQDSWLISGRLQNFISVYGGQLTVGAEGSYTHNKQKHVATLSTLNQTDSKIENQLYAGFVSYSRSFGELSGEAGVRYEYNKYDYYEHGVKIAEQSKDYNYFTPSFQLMYRGDVSVSISYRTLTSRPAYSQLSDRHQYNNEYLYESGNRYLLPRRSRTVSLGLQWKSLSAGLDYTHTKDDILYSTKYDNSLGVALSKPYNVPNTHSLNLQSQWSPVVGAWKPTFQALVTKPFYEYDGQKYKDMSATFIVRNLLDFSKSGFNFSLNGTYFTGGSQQLNDVNPYWQVDFLANKIMLKGKLRISLSIEDIFNSYNPTAKLGNDGLTLRMKQRSDIRKVSLTLRYYLPTKKNRYDGRSSSSEINRL